MILAFSTFPLLEVAACPPKLLRHTRHIPSGISITSFPRTLHSASHRPPHLTPTKLGPGAGGSSCAQRFSLPVAGACSGAQSPAPAPTPCRCPGRSARPEPHSGGDKRRGEPLLPGVTPGQHRPRGYSRSLGPQRLTPRSQSAAALRLGPRPLQSGGAAPCRLLPEVVGLGGG